MKLLIIRHGDPDYEHDTLTAGAKALIDAGLFDAIHPVCFGVHNWPSVETGAVVCREGAVMAGSRLRTQAA